MLILFSWEQGIRDRLSDKAFGEFQGVRPTPAQKICIKIVKNLISTQASQG
jgi:hypothetical protein